MASIKGKHLLVVIGLAVLLYRWKSCPTEVIEISQGRIQGIIEKSRFGRNFYSFRGIPYAAPPLEKLRFEPPQEALPWEGILDASNFRDVCLQPTTIGGIEAPGGSEDCLYLNVYTPELPTGSNVSLPVMVFFHGGIYTFGSGSHYGAEYFMDEGVVLVTVNYRLLSFGFLSTGDGTNQGNMGLKDQSMSLRWVQKNIVYFGGDPNKVTIFGQSAGMSQGVLAAVNILNVSSDVQRYGVKILPRKIVHCPLHIVNIGAAEADEK